MWQPEVIIALITTAFGGGGLGGYLTYKQAVSKEKLEKTRMLKEHELALKNAEAAHALAAANQPVEHYRTLVATFENRLKSVENEHSKCIDHQVKCEREVGELKGQVSVLTELVKENFTGLLGGLGLHVITGKPPITEVREMDTDRMKLRKRENPEDKKADSE